MQIYILLDIEHGTANLITSYNTPSNRSVTKLGGEERVADILEEGSQKMLQEQLLEGDEEKGSSHQKSSFRNFFCEPIVLGKDLYVIVKFGLVQYVSPYTSYIIYALFYSVPNFFLFCL